MTGRGGGYGKPPLHSRWKPGQSGNPKGRAARKPTPLVQQITELMDSRAKYRERGKTKTATWSELSLRMLVEQAVKGDIGAVEDVLKIYMRALRQTGGGPRLLVIENWLPDHPGQTAKEKAKAVEDARHTEPHSEHPKE